MENVADPIQYPTLTLGAETFEVRFRCGDIIRLKKDHGIDIGEVKQLKGSDALEYTLLLLSAGIAHQAKKTVEELADMVDLAELPKVSAALTEALKKASPQTPAEVKPNGAIQ